MTKDEIKESIDDIDDEVLLTIIDCVKELVCKGIGMYAWDRDAIMDEFDNVCQKMFIE